MLLIHELEIPTLDALRMGRKELTSHLAMIEPELRLNVSHITSKSASGMRKLAKIREAEGLARFSWACSGWNSNLTGSEKFTKHVDSKLARTMYS